MRTANIDPYLDKHVFLMQHTGVNDNLMELALRIMMIRRSSECTQSPIIKLRLLPYQSSSCDCECFIAGMFAADVSMLGSAGVDPAL